MVLIGVVIGYLGANMNGATGVGGGAQPNVPTVPTAPTPPAIVKNVAPVDPSVDHIRGNPDAKVAVIEYSDFECPFCARVHPTYQQVMEEYGDDVMWVYRHFPLNSIHPNAQKAAEASECAAELGGNDKFWELADIMFERGTEYDQLSVFAQEIGLNKAAFETCLSSGKYEARISSDAQGGADAGVSGTPGNFVYNVETKEAKYISGAQAFSAFKSAIDASLAE